MFSLLANVSARNPAFQNSHESIALVLIVNVQSIEQFFRLIRTIRVLLQELN